MSARKFILASSLVTAVLASGCVSLPDYEPITPTENAPAHQPEPAYEPAPVANAEGGFEAEAREELLKTREFANMTSDQYERLRAAEQALQAGNSKTAYDSLKALNSELEVANMVYTVLAGDSLWGISSHENVYGNPYWWPLIFKNNMDQIKDPDMIHIGQELNIEIHPTIGNVNAAVQHAHNRGSWAVGEVEEADDAFVGR